MGINSIRPRSPHRTHLASFTAIKSRKENLKVECFTIAYMVMQHNTLKVQAAKNKAKVLMRKFKIRVFGQLIGLPARTL